MTEFARKLKVTPAQISNVELGISGMTLERTMLAAKVLGVTIDELTGNPATEGTR